MDIPSLDGLRAVSILIVFVAHVGFESIVPGGLGVTVFFVLSGFLITTLLRLELEASGRVSLSRFYVRRSFRILPMFYAVLFGAAALSLAGVLAGPPELWPFLSEAGHFYNFASLFDRFSSPVLGTGVYWSLAVEEHFYLVFPVVFAALAARRFSVRSTAKVLAAACVAVLVWRCVLVFGFHASRERTYFGSDTRADSLLMGCVAALIGNPVVDGVRRSRRFLGWSAFFGLLVVFASLVFRRDDFRETFRYSLQSAAAVAVLRYLVTAPMSLAGRILNSRPLVLLGQLSFGFYLVHHVVIIRLFGVWSSRLVVAVVAFPLSVALALALRSLVERPSVGWRNRVLARLDAAGW